jgi:transcriptional regulator with XRE-family HTH domain
MARVLRTVERVIEVCGGTTAMARQFGISPQTVSNWKRRGNIPRRPLLRNIVPWLERRGYRVDQSILEGKVLGCGEVPSQEAAPAVRLDVVQAPGEVPSQEAAPAVRLDVVQAPRRRGHRGAASNGQKEGEMIPPNDIKVILSILSRHGYKLVPTQLNEANKVVTYDEIEVARRLKRFREAVWMGKCQRTFARHIGCSPARWNNYEGGDRRLDIEVALTLRAMFGVTLEWLYAGDPRGLASHLRTLLGSQ